MLTMIRSLDFASYLGCKWGFWRRKAKRDFFVAIRNFAIGLRGVDNWQVSASNSLSTRFSSLLSELFALYFTFVQFDWTKEDYLSLSLAWEYFHPLVLEKWGETFFFLVNLYIVDEFGASLPLPGEYSCFHAWTVSPWFIQAWGAKHLTSFLFSRRVFVG